MEKLSRSLFIADQLDTKSYDVFNWDMFLISSIYRNEIKDIEAEKEIIRGYAKATNCLFEEIKRTNHPSSGELILTVNSLVVPFVFLCRHTVELIIKYLRNSLSIPPTNTHPLLALWNDVENALIEKAPSDSSLKEFIENAKIYISVLEELDPDGTRARYSKSTSGKPYHSKPKYIRVIALNDVLQRMLLPLIE